MSTPAEPCDPGMVPPAAPPHATAQPTVMPPAAPPHATAQPPMTQPPAMQPPAVALPAAPPTPAPPRVNGLGIAAVIVGPVALFHAALVPVPYVGLLAVLLALPLVASTIVLSHMALAAAHRLGAGRVLAIIGFVCGYGGLAIITVTIARFVLSFAFAGAHVLP